MSANTEQTDDGTDTKIITAQVRKTLVERVDETVEDRADLANRSEAIRRGLKIVIAEDRGDLR